MMTPREFARDYIVRWEDGGATEPARTHSLDPADPGNWSGGKAGQGLLLGSNHGVTAIALASRRRVPITAITRETMHALGVDEAAQIALDAYYLAPRLDLLTWGPCAASAMDMGWGAGPGQAVRLVQRLIDAKPDGNLGPVTAASYNAALARMGEPFLAGAFWQSRLAFYETIIAANATLARYRDGWRNRSRYFTPGHPEGWWGRFSGTSGTA